MIVTAILVDGGFYYKRAQYLFGDEAPRDRAYRLMRYCQEHIAHDDEGTDKHLYRIFYYDCPPLATNVFHPFLGRQVDLRQTPTYKWMSEFHQELKHMRKVALRMGTLAESQSKYKLTEAAFRSLYKKEKTFAELVENDFMLDVVQKGVDMKIGIDIASLAYKKLVNQVVLISGDSDFVPIVKLARREGIDVILDPMRARVKDNLSEHVDGLKTYVPKESGHKVVEQ